jgi:signal transduction histidine kinase
MDNEVTAAIRLPADDGYWRRVRRDLNPRACAVVATLGLLISTLLLFQPHLFEIWTVQDVALAWAEYFAEIALIGLAMLAAVALVEQSPLPPGVVRWLLLAAALGLSAVAAIWLIAWRESGNFFTASLLGLFGKSIQFSLLGVFVLGVRALHRRAERADAEARQIEAAGRELERQTEEAQLQLLQAQIEPHFLFNTLANLRRLYRTQPAAGAEMIDSLMLYLRAALPQVRRDVSTLGDEFDLVRAYLQLFKMRMGARLRFILDLPPELRGAPFPPMMAVTLVENAIKHGLAPADLGGTVRVAARRERAMLELSVSDDGVGFGVAPSGTGVGLVNIRRQLAARYGQVARLTLEQPARAGVCARIVVPWQPTDVSRARPAAALIER